MDTENTQPHVDEKVEAPAQEETSQPVAETPTAQPGAETKETETKETTAETTKPVEPAKPRTYSEDEVRKIQHDSDQQAAQLRQVLGRLSMQQQIQQLQQQEGQAQAQDRQEVEAGNITEQQAQQRSQQRIDYVRLQGVLNQQRTEGEQNARILVAQKISQEFGVPIESIIREPDPYAMERKAAKLVIKQKDDEIRKAKSKPESFDKGPQSESTGPTSYEDSLKSRYPTMYPKK